jgi:glutathione S-transferase
LSGRQSVTPGRPSQVDITSAVAWSFIQLMVADVVRADAFPALQAHAARWEATELFKRYPQV